MPGARIALTDSAMSKGGYDAFVVYISKSSSEPGRLIAQGNNWTTTYSLPSITLTPGTYYLNIEATNYGGRGG